MLRTIHKEILGPGLILWHLASTGQVASTCKHSTNFQVP